MMKQIPMGIAVLLVWTGAASASSATVGPLTCWSGSRYIEMRDCVARGTGEGGTFGHCTIVTTEGGKKVVTRLVGVMKRWGGVHPIRKSKRFLEMTYRRGRFTCRFTPSPEYVVGDCVAGPASGTCTVVKSSSGSKQYFKATVSAHPD